MSVINPTKEEWLVMCRSMVALNVYDNVDLLFEFWRFMSPFACIAPDTYACKPAPGEEIVSHSGDEMLAMFYKHIKGK